MFQPDDDLPGPRAEIPTLRLFWGTKSVDSILMDFAPPRDVGLCDWKKD